jgi:hypothetical protein
MLGDLGGQPRQFGGGFLLIQFLNRCKLCVRHAAYPTLIASGI